MFKYLPHTKEDIDAMLKTIGVESIEALYQDVPKSLKQHNLSLPSSHSELELQDHFLSLAQDIQVLKPVIGMGAYDHYTPSIIRHIIERQEFLTSYTPYQPEISQGTLQYIFEFQSMISQLTGMEIANASLYDGATATAEAMFMICAIRKKQRILVSDTINPNILSVINTYAHYKGIIVDVLEHKQGVTSLEALKNHFTDEHAGLIVQSPNVYGLIEDYTGFKEVLDENQGLWVLNQDPSTLAHLKTPAAWGVDVAVGEAQSLGLPLQFGGPYIGYLASKKAYVRKMPGRICGMTKDSEGKRAFVLTFQAREQHIRRAKANSNICSNQSLLALFVTIYLATMGKKGLYEAAQLSMDAAYDLHEKLLELPIFEPVFEGQPFFKEFTLKSSLPVKTLQSALETHGYLGPYNLEEMGLGDGTWVSFAMTEKRSEADVKTIIKVLEALV